MSNINGTNIRKGTVSNAGTTSADEISGFILRGPASGLLALDSHATVVNLKEVEALGIDAKYDTSNGVNSYRQLKEFYRTAGENTELHLMLVAGSESLSDILENKAPSFLAASKGRIKQLAVACNPTGTDAIVQLNGMPAEVFNAIAKAQGLANWAYDNHMPCQVFLEGYAYGGTASSAANLRAIESLEANKVTVFIGQDFGYAEGLTDNAKKYADVGTLLGVVAQASINENAGNNEKFNLTDVIRESWIEPSLSSHTKNTDVFQDLQSLEDKGFVFGLEYVGMEGVRINNDHVCAPIVVDVDGNMNEHTIALGRVMDKAVRGLRSAYLPKIKTDWPVDATTGKLSPAVVASLENFGDQVFDGMVERGEISFGKTTVDPDSDLLVEKVLNVSFKIVPKGQIGELEGVINLSKSKS